MTHEYHIVSKFFRERGIAPHTTHNMFKERERGTVTD